MPLTFKEVAEILKLIDASECDEFVLEVEGTRIVVRRNSAGERTTVPVAAAAAMPDAAPAEPPDRVGDAAADPAPKGEPGLLEVRSPMVGTFYRRPSPDEPPFVEVGAKVKKGETLCLVEVMKLFTAVEAPEDGEIVEIVLEDSATIEFDQLLFRMRV